MNLIWLRKGLIWCQNMRPRDVVVRLATGRTSQWCRKHFGNRPAAQPVRTMSDTVLTALICCNVLNAEVQELSIKLSDAQAVLVLGGGQGRGFPGQRKALQMSEP